MEPPIGRHLNSVSRITQKAFNDALEEAGGNLPIWLVLLAVKRQGFDTQQELARAVGIEGSTLTHHLDAMELEGLVVRKRDPKNRRAVRVELTPSGETMFTALHETATDFDRRLRKGVSAEEVGVVRSVLTRLAENVGPGAEPG